MNNRKHLEQTIQVRAACGDVFAFADEHRNFSSHMNRSNIMMAGSKMETATDSGSGKRVGSHVTIGGTVLGVKLFLDEVVTVHEPPHRKEWQTVGDIRLLVIGHYSLGFEIKPDGDESLFRVYIDYFLPEGNMRWLGMVLGKTYARWCVGQMANGVLEHFN